MSCAKYREEMAGVAAGQRQMARSLESHLGSCAPCAEVFLRERELFAAVDSGLRLAANAEAPSNVYANVPALVARTGDGGTGVGRRRTAVLAIAAVALIAVFLGQHSRDAQPADGAKGRTSSSIAASSTAVRQALAVPPATGVGRAAGPSGRRGSVSARRPAGDQQRMIHGNTREPETLVPTDQEALLVRYAAALNRRNSPSATVANVATPAADEAMKVDLILIAELDVKPLAEQ